MKPLNKLIFFLLACLATSANAQQDVEVAQLDSIEGNVTIELVGENSFHPAERGQKFHVGDTIRTGSNSRAGVIFSSGVLLRLSSGATLQFQGNQNQPLEALSLESGKGYFFSRSPQDLPPINTPAVTTAVRGTEFVVDVDKQTTEVSVLSGRVECFNQYGSALLNQGELAKTQRGHAPVKGVLLHPNDAIEWVINYPLIIEPLDLARQIGLSQKDLSSIEAGDFVTALSHLDTNSSAQALLLKSELYLARGEMNNARAALDRAASAARSSASQSREIISAIDSQRAIVALVQNDKTKAAELLNNLHDNGLDSAQSNLAYSYLLQSNGEIESAYAIIEKVDHSVQWRLARMAELALAKGDTLAALELAQEDVRRNPKSVQSLTLLGFIHLARTDVDAALVNFSDAQQIDASASLAHLGIGLAHIRKGDLTNGRAEIERAVYLDPATAVYRSYLGKAFFEENKFSLAANELDQAITLDSKDPTPYLYRAYLELSQNNPVAALEDVEHSIALNNNRAVYRSSLLLDQDSAVRSAGLAEVFTSLGFDKVAKVEAIKSINQDYSNYSAHRLLADSYQTIYLDDARITEQRITNLLAPLSFNLYSQGSSASSINEYNSLFDRVENRTAFELTAQDLDDLYALSAQNAGQSEHFGYLVKGLSAVSGGSRHGDFMRRYQPQIILQYQGQPEDRFIFDSNANFYETRQLNASPQDVELDSYQFSLGQSHNFSSNTKMISDLSFSNERNDFLDRAVEQLVDLNQTIDGELLHLADSLLLDDFSLERVQSERAASQLIYNSDLLGLIGGFQIAGISTDRRQDAAIVDDQQGLFTGLEQRLNTRAQNDLSSVDEYVYSTLHAANWIDLNLGFNQTDLEVERREVTPFADGSYGRSKFSPKAGASLYAGDSTIFRFGYFETLRKSVLEDRSELEPSLVGGLNQRFTDDSASRARNFGAAVDYKIPGDLYLGAEALHRHAVSDIQLAGLGINLDGDEPLPQVNLESVVNDHREQDVASAYISKVLSRRFVTTINFDRFNNNRTDREFGDEININRAAGELRYFDPSGFFGFVRGTWRKVDPSGPAAFMTESDSFTLLDLGSGYRLPNRHGTIALQINNILDRNFDYDQSNGFESAVRPERYGSVVFSVNF